jgi:hypothetical protein
MSVRFTDWFRPLPPGGQVLPLAAQVPDQPVQFGEPGAAPAGPVGRPDVLRRGRGPGAQLQAVAVLRPGCHHGGTARTAPLVTRNTSDVASSGVQLLNPFELPFAPCAAVHVDKPI